MKPANLALAALTAFLVALTPVAADNDTAPESPVSQEDISGVAEATTEGGIFSFLSYVVPSSSTIANAIQIFMIVVAGLSVVAAYKYYLWWTSFKHRVVLRRRLNDNTQVEFLAAKITSEDDGNKVILRENATFFSQNVGQSVPEQPGCIEQRSDGTYVLYGLRDSQGDITWAKPNVKWDDKDSIDVDPASGVMRAEWINQKRKSDSLRGEDSWLEKNSTVIVTTISLVMIVFAMGYFIDKINTPAKQLANNAKQVTSLQLELAKELSRTGCIEPRVNATTNTTAPNPGGTIG